MFDEKLEAGTARCSAGGGISGRCRFIEHDLDKRQNICYFESVKRKYFHYCFIDQIRSTILFQISVERRVLLRLKCVLVEIHE